MESPMSKTRGRFVSLAWEIQMSHHSIDSCAGCAVADQSAARLIARAAERASARNRLPMLAVLMLCLQHIKLPGIRRIHNVGGQINGPVSVKGVGQYRGPLGTWYGYI